MAKCDDLAGENLERVKALEALGDDGMKSLMSYAHLQSSGTDVDGKDLFQGACLRWLTSKVAIGGVSDTYKYMVGAINSLRSNAFRHQDVVKEAIGERKFAKVENDADPLYEVAARTTPADDALFIQQIYDLVADDPDLQLLVMCQGQQATRAEIMKELGWDDKKYETVRKRKVRRIAKLMSEGVI